MVRDFFDLLHAVREEGLSPHNPNFLQMVKSKIEVPGNDPINVSAARKYDLQSQLEVQLKQVLRPKDYMRFSLDEAFKLTYDIAAALPM